MDQNCIGKGKLKNYENKKIFYEKINNLLEANVSYLIKNLIDESIKRNGQ